MTHDEDQQMLIELINARDIRAGLTHSSDKAYVTMYLEDTYDNILGDTYMNEVRTAAERHGVTPISVSRAMKITGRDAEFSACYVYASQCAVKGKTHESNMRHAESIYKAYNKE